MMTHICRESEASLDYYSLFRAIMKRTPLPMSPLESLASSAVRTAHKVWALMRSIVTMCSAPFSISRLNTISRHTFYVSLPF